MPSFNLFRVDEFSSETPRTSKEMVQFVHEVHPVFAVTLSTFVHMVCGWMMIPTTSFNLFRVDEFSSETPHTYKEMVQFVHEVHPVFAVTLWTFVHMLCGWNDDTMPSFNLFRVDEFSSDTPHTSKEMVQFVHEVYPVFAVTLSTFVHILCG